MTNKSGLNIRVALSTRGGIHEKGESFIPLLGKHLNQQHLKGFCFNRGQDTGACSTLIQDWRFLGPKTVTEALGLHGFDHELHWDKQGSIQVFHVFIIGTRSIHSASSMTQLKCHPLRVNTTEVFSELKQMRFVSLILAPKRHEKLKFEFRHDWTIPYALVKFKFFDVLWNSSLNWISKTPTADEKCIHPKSAWQVNPWEIPGPSKSVESAKGWASSLSSRCSPIRSKILLLKDVDWQTMAKEIS